MKNGPSLDGYGAIAMNTTLTTSMTKLPAQLRKTLTWDRGKELSGHAQFARHGDEGVLRRSALALATTGEREHCDGLLHPYFPKGTDLSRWTSEDLEAVERAINNRPRKVLGWRTPAEIFESQLLSLQQPSVATTSELAQYTSEQFGAACARMVVVQSMGRVGSALDNAVSESFNSVLKVEYVHRHTFATRTEARLRIATWITGFYNTRRRHSAAGGHPPIVFELMMAQARTRSPQDQMRTAA